MLTVASYANPADCDELIHGWNILLDSSDCANPFYSPEMLLTAWHCYGNPRLRLLAVWDGDALVALLPVTTEFNFNLFPVLHDKAWRYRHCFSCAPVLARGYEEQAMHKIISHVSSSGRLFSMYDIPLEGCLNTVLAGVGAGSMQTYIGSHERACLQPVRVGRESFHKRIRKKRLKEFQRQKKLLGLQGKLEFVVHKSAQACREKLDAFLVLEQTGWKGRSHTALLSNDSDRLFACTALYQMVDNGRLQVCELVLDKQPLAMLIVLSAGSEIYTFKIAHDPAYHRFSPGVQLMLACSEQWEHEGCYSMIDSCATPEHSLVNRLWYERRTIGKFHIAGDDTYTRTLLALRKWGDTAPALGRAA